jgi:hypothetical protein
VLSSKGRGRTAGHDDVHLEPDQLGCEVGEPLGPPLRKSVLEDDVLALDVAQLVQLLSECLTGVRGGRSPELENTYPIYPPRRLRPGSERYDKKTGGQDPEEDSSVHTEPRLGRVI